MARTSFVTFLASAARTVTGNSGEFNLYDHDEALVFLNVTAASGTSPTLNVKVQTKDPNGDWYDLVSFTQATAAAKEAKPVTVYGETLRIAYTVAGTTPSFTFTVTAIAKAKN